MISFDFAYYKPDTLAEAAQCYNNLIYEKQSVLYYGGGTEIISMARAESIKFDAVIDYKNIPECNVLAKKNGNLIIGSAVTLTQIAESNYFPLLGKTVSRIADHTIQGKITLGGNLGGTIIYREAALPLMIINSRAIIMTKNGLKEKPFGKIFDGKLKLGQGEFIVQILIELNDTKLPFNHVKRTKNDKIDYPLITMAAIKKNGKIQSAISGMCNTPILLSSEVLNNTCLTKEERISKIIKQIRDLIISDIHGSREYRVFVLRNILDQLFTNFKGV